MRAPRLGHVKSRLSRALGARAVLALYRCFVKDTLVTVSAAGGDALLFVHPPEAMGAVSTEFALGQRVYPQEGVDLGERMANAFARVFAAGYRRALLVGVDIPHLSPQVYRDAFDALHRREVVIGPASDGGYYLIGFREDSFQPEVFQKMPWGTDRVLRDTCARLAARGHPPYRLPLFTDLDEYEDLLTLEHRHIDGARMTREWLKCHMAGVLPNGRGLIRRRKSD